MTELLTYLSNPTAIGLVLGGILTGLFGLLSGISKEKRTPKCIAWGSFIAGLIVLSAGVYAGYQNQVTEAEDRRKASRIEGLSKKIVELALENARLNNEIANSVSGGDSYCHLMVSVSSNRIDH